MTLPARFYGNHAPTSTGLCVFNVPPSPGQRQAVGPAPATAPGLAGRGGGRGLRGTGRSACGRRGRGRGRGPGRAPPLPGDGSAPPPPPPRGVPVREVPGPRAGDAAAPRSTRSMSLGGLRAPRPPAAPHPGPEGRRSGPGGRPGQAGGARAVRDLARVLALASIPELAVASVGGPGRCRAAPVVGRRGAARAVGGRASPPLSVPGASSPSPASSLGPGPSPAPAPRERQRVPGEGRRGSLFTGTGGGWRRAAGQAG